MKPLRHLAWLLGAAAVLATAACGSSTTATPPVPASPTPASSSAPATSGSAQPTRSPTDGPTHSPTRSATPSSSVQKLLVYVVENHSLDQMRGEMPYVASLADQYGYASHYTAESHPSLPNYLAMVGGDTFGVQDDDPPSSHPISGSSVFGEAVKAGRTAKVYADAMTTPCQADSAGTYAVKHNAWAYFTDEASLCHQDDVPISGLAPDVQQGHLPTIGMVVPDLCHDAHDCSLSEADTWLRTSIGQVMGGPDWRSGRLAIVVTADEDDDQSGNQVLTVVADPALHHQVVSTPLNHYSLSRSYADVAGVTPLRQAATATPLLQAFGLHAG